jgi:hypothetical protein
MNRLMWGMNKTDFTTITILLRGRCGGLVMYLSTDSCSALARSAGEAEDRDDFGRVLKSRVPRT